MRLLLDEMISPKVARELRGKGHDVQSVSADRTELRATPDIAIVRVIHGEQRSIVTNNIKDFQPIHSRFLAQGEDHSGMVFTLDSSLPRGKRSIPLWVKTLEALLRENPADDALKNRTKSLP